MTHQLIRMGTALGLGIVLGVIAMLALQPPPRVRPCPHASFHHASPR